MTKYSLLKKLEEIYDDNNYDRESAHVEIDELLLQYINDPEIRIAYEKFIKWYA